MMAEVPDAEPKTEMAPESDASADTVTHTETTPLETPLRSAAFARASDGGITGAAVLAAMGGWRGVVEALAPGIVFLVLFITTHNLVLSVAVPAALALVALIVRLMRREPVGGAATGMLGIVISGLIALATGSGADYYLLGLWTNAVYGLGLTVTMLIGWPLIGILAGLTAGIGTRWRQHRRTYWWMQMLTLVFVAVFAARLAVQLPLYQAGAVEALGTARLVMGVPLFAVALVVTAVTAMSVLKRVPTEDAVASAKVS